MASDVSLESLVKMKVKDQQQAGFTLVDGTRMATSRGGLRE